MSDPSRAKSAHRPDADGTRVEDDRQLTELLLQNRVSVTTAPVESVRTNDAPSFSARIKTGFLLFVGIPFLLLAYFSSRAGEDDVV